MHRLIDREAPAQERLDTAVERVQSHLQRARGKQKTHLKSWAREAAHVAFELHPELREDGSLFRYFVAKAGRQQGLRGTALTAFVDQRYADGTWWRLVPEDVLIGRPREKS